MSENRSSILYEQISPIKLGVIILVLSTIGTLVWFLNMDMVTRASEKIYLVPVAFTMFFVVVSSLLSYNATNPNRYWTHSMMAYIGLVLLSLGLVRLLSGVPLEDAASYKWILVVITLCYVVFLGMISVMKNIVEIAQRQDKKWNKE